MNARGSLRRRRRRGRMKRTGRGARARVYSVDISEAKSFRARAGEAARGVIINVVSPRTLTKVYTTQPSAIISFYNDGDVWRENLPPPSMVPVDNLPRSTAPPRRGPERRERPFRPLTSHRVPARTRPQSILTVQINFFVQLKTFPRDSASEPLSVYAPSIRAGRPLTDIEIRDPFSLKKEEATGSTGIRRICHRRPRGRNEIHPE